MAALDKLINLLEQVKETNPDFTAKAEKALDVLVSEDEDQEVDPPDIHGHTIARIDHGFISTPSRGPLSCGSGDTKIETVFTN